jgi:hypothetical protein
MGVFLNIILNIMLKVPYMNFLMEFSFFNVF